MAVDETRHDKPRPATPRRFAQADLRDRLAFGFNRAESDSVNGAICLYCPGDFPTVLGDPVPVCYEDLLTGEPTHENEALLKEINPMSYVRKGAPPFLFFHGDIDNVVYYRSSMNLYEKLLSAGAEADYYLLEGAGHCENAFTQENIQELMLQFIKKHT